MVDNQENPAEELPEADRIDLEAAVLAIYSYVYTQGERENVYRKMQDILEPHGIAEGNIDKVRRTVSRHGGQLPLAIVEGAFTFAWDEVGVPEDLARKAISLMKDEEIIVQCGRGYGKAIVLTRASFDLFDNNYRAEAVGVNRQEEAEEAREVAEQELNEINGDEVNDANINEMADQLEDAMDAAAAEREANPQVNLMPDAEDLQPELFEAYVGEAEGDIAIDNNMRFEIRDDEDVEMTPEELLLTLTNLNSTFLNMLEAMQRDVALPLIRAREAMAKIQEDMEAQPEGDAAELQAEVERLKKELERAQMVAWQ